jgi:hypothetical protein
MQNYVCLPDFTDASQAGISDYSIKFTLLACIILTFFCSAIKNKFGQPQQASS